MRIYHSEGTIEYRSRSYLDQLSKEEKWVGCRIFEEYLKNTYKLSLQQYYNLIIFGNINHVQLCCYCKKKEVNFISLRKGYYDYCSQSCITTERLLRESKEGNNIFQDPDFIESNRIRVSERNSELFKEGKHHFQTKECMIESSRIKFIQSNEGYDCSVYIAKVEGTPYYKIGASRGPVRFRNAYRNHYLKNHHVLFNGTNIECADLEAKFKKRSVSKVRIYQIRRYKFSPKINKKI